MEAFEDKEIIYEFGRFVLDPTERLLLSDGQPVHLRAKEFETLLLLLENNGRAISKEEMIDTLWQGAFVEEGSLVKQISRLRKVFNGDGGSFIETLPKHGYRFSAEVKRTIRPSPAGLRGERPVQGVRLGFENETCSATSPTAKKSPDPTVHRGIYILAALVFIGGTAAGLVWFWSVKNRPASLEARGILFLTDGSHSDSGGRLSNDGRIYFSRQLSNARFESWVMNADGSDARRANYEIKDLLHGVWSRDGKKVVFTKEGDTAIYLADANGANEVTLSISGGNMDWSPDGSQFVHQAKVAHDKNEIFLYTVATGENQKLTDHAAADPSFSYDGKQVAFTSWHDGNPEVYVMNTDGSNVRRLTDHPAFDQYPVFTPDGTAVAFQSNREDERIEIYLQDLIADTPPIRITNSDTYTGLSSRSWSADGTRLLLYTNQNGKNRIFWADVEPSRVELVLSDESSDLSYPRIAPDGTHILSQARLFDRSIELRLTDLKAGRTKAIFKTGPNYPPDYSLSPAFSPDATHIAFNDRVNGNSEIFVIKADGSGLRNLSNDPSTDTNPVFSPNGGEIIFSRDFYGKSKLYRMDLDGGRQRRLTESEGYEINGGFSIDGSTLAFAADRQNEDSRGLDIYLLDLKHPSREVRLTNRRFHDGAPAFSPDGGRIAFASNADGNFEIYLMNRDGSGLRRLTRNVAEDNSPQWSPDGQKIVFSSKRAGKSAIYEVRL